LIPLPTSKLLDDTIPGRIGFLNSFPAAIALSPDGRYAAVLNNGYGTAESQARQSIAVLDLSTFQLRIFLTRDSGQELTRVISLV
jgi:hypothetical protein